jgi:hypothetical protein
MNNENLTFLSASNLGSYLQVPSPGTHLRYYSTNFTKDGFIFNDFVGLNTNIYDPLDASESLLGYPQQTVTDFLNYDYQGGLIYGLSLLADDDYPFRAGTILNGLIHHRQGPYGWPTWKQIRGNEHPLSRYWRKNNVFSYGQKTSTNKAVFSKNTNQDKFSSTDVRYQEIAPALCSRYKALEHNFIVEQDHKNTNLFLKHSYGNIESHYSSEKINFYLVFPESSNENINPIYDDLKKIYITKDFAYNTDAENPYGKQVPFKLWKSFIYSENVFPRERNSYLAKTRKRTKYAEVAGTGPNGYDKRDFRTFWKSSLIDRNLRTPHEAINSQDYTVFDILSVWSLDTDLPTGSDGFRDVLGELQTGLGYYSTQQTDWSWCPYTASIVFHRTPIQHGVPPQRFDQWTYNVPYYATNLISSKSPFFNSYEDFIEDVRGLGKGYSIIPEFKISDHMDYYVKQKDGNFLAKNDKFLSLPGANITSSVNVANTEDSGLNEQFFLDYSNSDFMKYFSKFGSDHKKETIDSYNFKVKGIKKLLPYRGFYPSERVVQLGTILSQSFGDQLSGTFGDRGAGFTVSSAQNIALNAFLRQIISPGVVCNSLKSGIAVDFPALTGNIGGSVAIEYGVKPSGNIGYWVNNFNYRFPFEAAIEPHAYFPPTGTQDHSVHIGEPVKVGSNIYPANTTWLGSYSELYTMAANNFFGEIPKFFLKDQKLTTFTSNRESEFKSVESGKSYFMDVILKRTDDMVLCEGQYQPTSTPYTGSLQRGSIYGPPVSSSWANDVNGSNLTDPAYAAFTPPYFYEDSLARILYIPASSGQPTLSDILSQAKIETVYSGSSVFLGLNDTASKNKMAVSASVNLFQKGKSLETIYDAAGNILEYRESKDSTFDFWSIGTKFECPNINFSASTDYHSPSTGRGLWGGYGTLPTGSTGVFLELRESFKEFATNSMQSNTGSLIDVCGFKAANKRVGTVSGDKTISEAIVAIPYIWEDDLSPSEKKLTASTFKLNKSTKKRFFSIRKNTLTRAVKDANNEPDSQKWKSQSVTDMVLKMRKYNLPPQFDFLEFDSKAFSMYIFEFEHKLTQQDLSDIWQGLMPEISRTAELQGSSIQHPAGKTEFFQGKSLPKYTRWMVFKVKRKAASNYHDLIDMQQKDPRITLKTHNQEKSLPYNYNWPYDFFSLIELAKLETGIEFKPETTETNIIGVKSS